MTEHHSIIVVGAGLSGLYVVWRLQQQQRQDVVLLEARGRTGGRILSQNIGQSADSCIDMGPAWIWPDLQPRLQGLIAELDIKLFKQFVQGDMLYEHNDNKIERYSGQSSHDQSYRVVGGAQSLVNALQSQLPVSSIHFNTQLKSIDQHALTVQAIRDDKSVVYTAEKIILALPLRIVYQTIAFNPPIEKNIFEHWKNTPTWMAGHSKLVFIYEKAFWREQNLSGEVFSRHGPLTEIYDGSPDNEEFYALTSFVGLNAQQRGQIKIEQLIELCLAQLKRLFGEASQDVIDVQVKDWSRDAFTTTDIDLTTPPQHPQYPDSIARSFYNHQVILAGTESAREHGGYLEGALESAGDALSLLNAQL